MIKYSPIFYFLILILFLFIGCKSESGNPVLPGNTSSQWIQTSGPYGGDIRALAVNAASRQTDGGQAGGTCGTILFAGTNWGVYRSTNNGINWTQVMAMKKGTIALAVSGGNIFAGTLGGGIFRSLDKGASWTNINKELSSTYVRAFAVSPTSGGTDIFAETDIGVYHSTDKGLSWTQVNDGLTITSILALVVGKNGTGGINLYSGIAGGGVWRYSL